MYDQRWQPPATLTEFRGLFLGLRTSRLFCVAAIGRISRVWPLSAPMGDSSTVSSLSPQPDPTDDDSRCP